MFDHRILMTVSCCLSSLLPNATVWPQANFTVKLELHRAIKSVVIMFKLSSLASNCFEIDTIASNNYFLKRPSDSHVLFEKV